MATSGDREWAHRGKYMKYIPMRHAWNMGMKYCKKAQRDFEGVSEEAAYRASERLQRSRSTCIRSTGDGLTF